MGLCVLERCALGCCVLGTLCLGTLCLGALFLGSLCLGTMCLGPLCLGTLCLGTLRLGTLCLWTLCLVTFIVGFIMLVAVKERLADILLVAPEDLGSAPRGQQTSWWQSAKAIGRNFESVDTKLLQFLQKHDKQLQKGFWVAVNEWRR